MMPKLWTETIDAHRRAVHDAAVDAVAALSEQNGLASLNMSQIAQTAGIGRATLYKYFPDIQAILLAWHERQVARHLREVTGAAARPGPAAERLEAVLETYALVSGEDHSVPLAALLHKGDHVSRARDQIRDVIRELLAEAAEAGDVRNDFPPDELARFCLHAVSAAGERGSKASIRRLVALALAALRPPR